MTTKVEIGQVWRKPISGTEWRVTEFKPIDGERYVVLIGGPDSVLRLVTPRDLRRFYVRKEAA